MDTSEWISFTSRELYLAVSFFSGILLGYIIGKIET